MPLEHRSDHIRNSFRFQTSVIAGNLQSLANLLVEQQEIFSSLAVFPLAEYPGRTQEGLLGQLLRKKPEPAVEDWIDEGIKTGKAAQSQHSSTTQDEVSGHASVVMRELLLKYSSIYGTNYTSQERAMGVENVVTGLRRKLEDNYQQEEEGSEEEDEDGDEENAVGASADGDDMDIVAVNRRPSGIGIEFEVKKDVDGKMADLSTKRAMPMIEQLKFLTTGTLPRG